MIPHERAQKIGERLIMHLEAKLALEEQCDECGCFPITAAEIKELRGILKDHGVESVGEQAPAQAVKPLGSVPFPRRAEG
jgi:hypothetical protein